jgi:hypothetical protein
MNNASVYYPNYKQIRHKHPLSLPLPVMFASWCLPYKNPAAISQHIWNPFSIEPVLHFGNVLMAFSPCSSERDPIFPGKIQMGKHKMKFQ